MKGELSVGLVSGDEFLHRTVRHADLARGGNIADHAGLDIGKTIGQTRFGVGVGETDHVTGQIAPRVAAQIEDDRFVPSVQPEGSGYFSFDPVIDFAPDYLFIDAPRHFCPLRLQPGVIPGVRDGWKEKMERAKRFELSTLTLARLRSTN